MRLRPRPTVKETSTHVPADDVPYGAAALPRKAQKLLGTKVQVNVSNSKENTRDDLAQLGKAEQKNMGTRFAAQKAPQIPLPSGLTDMPSWSTTAASSHSSSDALPTPTASARAQNYNSRSGYSPGVRNKQVSPKYQQSTESMHSEYYDSSKQPLYVSQQTSASAVRDMALRKGSPRVHEMASDQIPPRLSSKTASNAQYGDYAKPTRNENGSIHPKKPRKLDLTSLFPRPNASASQSRLLSPANYAHSPSTMTDLTEGFPQDTMRTPTGRFQAHKSPKTPSVNSLSTPRVKIFEPDIYDNTKTRSRKPPQGIKNWFDGFDISSDEDEIDPVELPANTPRPSVEAIPSDFSPYGLTAPGRNITNGVYSPSRPALENMHPMAPAKTAARHRMQSRSSESSTVTEDSSGATGGYKRSGESRFVHSRLDSQSVLSLSSESEDEKEMLSPVRDSRYAMEDEPTLTANLPSPVPRRPDNVYAFAQGAGLRTMDSTISTSGSIPIRLRDSTAAPMVVEDFADPSEAKALTLHPPPSVGNESGDRQVRSRGTSGSGHDGQGLKSPGGEASSNTPSDAAHVMAVTEEEMMLLELMRKKRAAMQNNSFQEGYRLALKQEQEFLSKRRQSAHNSVGKLLEERANRAERFSPNNSPDEAVPGAVPRKVESKESPPPNRYSVFQKLPNVAKGFNIDRYLASEPPQEDPPLSPNAESEAEAEAEVQAEPREERYVAKMARMERFLMMKPSLADAIYQERPVSGTEIETDTMTATEDEDAPSPMTRLAGMGREDARVISPPMDDEDEEDDLPEDSDVGYEEHHDKVRAFLQSSRASRNIGLTALPQMDSDEPSEEEEDEASLLSPPMLEDDQPTPRVLEQRIPALLIPGPRESKAQRTPSVESQQPLPQPVSKFQDRSRLDTVPDSAPTQLPSSRNRPSSISTGVASPLSRSFSNSTPDKPLADASRSPSSANAPYITTTAKRIGKVPNKIDTTGDKTVGRITSMSSMTSAGEDVLAAWAELGGGSDALAARRRGR